MVSAWLVSCLLPRLTYLPCCPLPHPRRLRVNITDAFELQYEVGPDGALKIPPAYVNEKRELHAAVNKDAEVMGW